MSEKLTCALLLFLATCGCRACDNSCDYLPPVLDSPYTTHGMRSGSVTAGNYHIQQPVEEGVITPLPEEE